MSKMLVHLTKQKRQKRKDVRAARAVKSNVSDAAEQEAQLSQIDRATLRVIKYFAKSLKNIQDHLAAGRVQTKTNSNFAISRTEPNPTMYCNRTETVMNLETWVRYPSLIPKRRRLQLYQIQIY